MVESTRTHGRLRQQPLPADVISIDGVLPQPVVVYVTPFAREAKRGDLVIHFHGASWVPVHEASSTHLPLVIASVNLGAGSRRYATPFEDAAVFTRLLDRIRGLSPATERVYLTGFSAGYGAIREILRDHSDAIEGVLLLDGLHASYVPEEKPLADGGVLDESNLEVFVEYARRAVAGEKKFVITHSEIFPGTFASTTETSDFLLNALELKRTPVLEWGPLGMQQLSDAARGNFHVLGFAGNTAPDHVDHLHAYRAFLLLLLQ